MSHSYSKNPEQFWKNIKTIINTLDKVPINEIEDGNN